MTKDNCNNCYNFILYPYSTTCLECGGSPKNRKPLTHADRIRSMSDEELAAMLAWPYIASPSWCAEHTTCPYIGEDPTPCNKCALGWLKQEATDD